MTAIEEFLAFIIAAPVWYQVAKLLFFPGSNDSHKNTSEELTEQNILDAGGDLDDVFCHTHNKNSVSSEYYRVITGKK